MSAVQGEVRWIVDDCKTFMRREVNRIQQNERPRYDGIILDPPAFGRFGNKVWKIDEDLPEVLAMLPDLLTDEPLFVLLTSHDINWPGDKLKDSLTEVMNKKSVNGLMEFGTMYLKSVNRVDNGKPTPRLEMGTFARWARKFV